VPFMSEAVAAYRQVSASSEFKEYERIRSKARHDEAQALYNARLTGKSEGIVEGAEQERQKWQGVADENEELRNQIAELRAKYGEK